MLGSVALATVVAFGVPTNAPATACPPPSPCVCICTTAPAPPPAADGGITATRGAPAPAALPPIEEDRLSGLRVARAAPSLSADTAGAGNRGGWYGGPAIVTDALSMAFLLYGGFSNGPGTFYFGLAGYALGGPINHLAHGESKRALVSLGLRALGGGLAAYALLQDVLVNHCDNDVVKCGDPRVSVAIASVFVLGAMTIDDALLARATEATAAPAHPARAMVSPGILVGPGLAFASLGGRF